MNSVEFLDRREKLKADIDTSDRKSKQMAAEIKATKLQAKEAKPGSKQKTDLRARLVVLSTKYQLYLAKVKEDFLRQESTIYKDVYLKTQDAVTKYSKRHRISLVLRFNRNGVAKAKSPKEILSRMNELVIHYESAQDITNPVLAELNRRYREKK